MCRTLVLLAAFVLSMIAPSLCSVAFAGSDSRNPASRSGAKIDNLLSLFDDGNDAVRRSLNLGRAKLTGTAFDSSMTVWYADLERGKWMSTLLMRRLHESLSMLGVGRKLLAVEGSLTWEDYATIESVLRLLDQECAAAPVGFLEETLTRLRASIGMSWEEIVAALSKPYAKFTPSTYGQLHVTQ